ncbi:unnamed protein product [Thelazia callipaeda]|uniref:MFS domain-containing protein n=1 Tax=Thelazia callipaeda TaxID=103827 RepID=A0A0N5CLF8_THECL|nr:unnamed protein product [Thelazia callipaeda]
MPVMFSAFVTESTDECSTNGTFHTDKKLIAKCMENSLISQFSLHGNQRYLAEWTTSAFMLGNMIGASTLTRLSDRYGRRPVLVFSLLALGITGLLCALANSITMFAVCRLLQGICSPGSLLVAWVLSYESVPIGLRGFVTLIYGLMWVIGYCTVAPLAYFVVNWRWLIVSCSAPSMLLAVLYFYIVPESLHFLIANNRKEKAVNWIRNAEKYGNVVNKTNLNTMVELLESGCCDAKGCENDISKTNKNSRFLSVKELLNHKIFIIYTLILIFLWSSDTFVYYGLSLYTTHLAGNKYWNFVLSGLVELPAYIFTPPALKSIGRKRFVAFMHFLVGFSHMVLIFIPPGRLLAENNQNNKWLSISCWLIGKFGISSSFISLYVYGSEIFPTTIRNVCLGICVVIARLGGIIAPYVTILGSVNALLPIILFGSVAMIAAIFTFILPETKNRELPSSLNEAVKVNHSYLEHSKFRSQPEPNNSISLKQT